MKIHNILLMKQTKIKLQNLISMTCKKQRKSAGEYYWNYV